MYLCSQDYVVIKPPAFAVFDGNAEAGLCWCCQDSAGAAANTSINLRLKEKVHVSSETTATFSKSELCSVLYHSFELKRLNKHFAPGKKRCKMSRVITSDFPVMHKSDILLLSKIRIHNRPLGC